MAEENIANKIARQLFAMASKKRETNLVDNMKNERYQRSFTDRLYPGRRRGRLQPVDAKQKAEWEALAKKRDW